MYLCEVNDLNMPSFQQKTTTHDEKTGELNSTTHIFTKKYKGDAFVMYFITDAANQIRSKVSGLDAQLMDLILRDALFNKNYVEVSVMKRDEWMSELKMSHLSQFYRSKKALVASKAITVTKNRFIINAVAYWKGDTATLEEMKEAKRKEKQPASDTVSVFENEKTPPPNE